MQKGLTSDTICEYWISCPKMTVLVQTKDSIIVDCADIIRKFKGQKLDNLIGWLMKKFGEVEVERI